MNLFTKIRAVTAVFREPFTMCVHTGGTEREERELAPKHHGRTWETWGEVLSTLNTIIQHNPNDLKRTKAESKNRNTKQWDNLLSFFLFYLISLNKVEVPERQTQRLVWEEPQTFRPDLKTTGPRDTTPSKTFTTFSNTTHPRTPNTRLLTNHLVPPTDKTSSLQRRTDGT